MCKGCGRRSRSRSGHVSGRQVKDRGVARVPADIAAYVEYTGLVKLAVRGPRTGKMYGEVSSGETLAVYKEDATYLLTMDCFRAGRAGEVANLTKVRKPKRRSQRVRAMLAVRSKI